MEEREEREGKGDRMRGKLRQGEERGVGGRKGGRGREGEERKDKEEMRNGEEEE